MVNRIFEWKKCLILPEIESRWENPTLMRRIIYLPLGHIFFAILAILLGSLFLLLFVRVVGVAFRKIFPTLGLYGVLILLVACLIGSSINVPLTKIRTKIPVVSFSYVTFFGITYPIPTIRAGYSETLLALNLGGAIIPIVASSYLLFKISSIILPAVLATTIVTIVVHALAKPVRGLGITTPFLIPPIIAAISAITATAITGVSEVYAVAYVAGTLGTLIGADILNLNAIPKLGAPVASIGGAGTFDGIFLTGIIAVLLA